MTTDTQLDLPDKEIQRILMLTSPEGRAASLELYAHKLRRECAALRTQVADLEEVLTDKRRLTRELDVALHGEDGAAKQASLCDLIGPAKKLRTQLAERDAEVVALRAERDKLQAMVDDVRTLAASALKVTP